jgi:hypothetical protein
VEDVEWLSIVSLDMILSFQMCLKTKKLSLPLMKNNRYIMKKLRNWKTWFVT